MTIYIWDEVHVAELACINTQIRREIIKSYSFFPSLIMTSNKAQSWAYSRKGGRGCAAVKPLELEAAGSR